MHSIKQIGMVVTVVSLVSLMPACATIQREDRIRAEVRDVVIAKPGDAVHLFYGMSQKAKEEFCPDAVVPVYRLGKGYYVSKSEVGKIKVVKDLGQHFIEAVVIEGEVRSGDIAMQANSECLIAMPRKEE